MATDAPSVSLPLSSTEDAPPPKPEQAVSENPNPVELPPATTDTANLAPSPEGDAALPVVTTREVASSEPEEGAVVAALEESVAAVTLEEEPKQEAAALVKEEGGLEADENQSPAAIVVESTTENDKSSSELKTATDEEGKTKRSIQPAVSFKEESYFVTDLTDSERKSLEELKNVVHEAINDNTLCPPPVPEQPASTSQPESDPEKNTTIESALKQDHDQQSELPQISIWGIPLLKDERTDVILLKFLRAREFKVTEAFAMLKRTLQWRAKFGIDQLLEEDLGDDLEKVVFMHGHDREGHPICYNVYGEFQNKELYQKTFADEEKRRRFLRWRIQFLEKSIRKLDFRPGGVNTLFQVNDLKNAPGPGKKELRQATRQGLHLLQDNYPEFVAKQVFINVPWWYVAFYTMMSPFMTQRTKSKFVFVGPAKTAETLFKYVSPEQVPIQYGGLSVDFCDCNPDFDVDDSATELLVKPTTKQFVEILVSEKCVIVWELRVVGWEVTYSAEFIPNTKDKYTVMIQKATKMSSSDDPVVSGSFKISDLGKIVLTVDNPSFKKRKLVYRYKVLPYPEE